MIVSRPQRVTKPFLTGGTLALLVVMAVGYAFGLARFFTGLGGITNLDDQYAWGIWKAINVAVGVALAASGFTSAALIDIFGRRRYRPLLRPAILTAWLGYLMVAVALLFDLGRYWSIWQPIVHWQGNSVLFEVAMCVIAYLVVLTFEMAPAILAGFQDRIKENDRGAAFLRRFEKAIFVMRYWLRHNLPFFITAGFVLSCMHHSSLGTLMLIAGDKLEAFWFTPLLPLLFLLSAMMVGLPMVIIEALIAARIFNYRPDVEMLGSLAAKVRWLVITYAALRVGDLAARHAQLDLVQDPGLTIALAVELGAGLLVPLILLSSRTLRRSPGWLMSASLLIVFGVALNRLSAYLVGYKPLFAGTRSYFPSIGEMALTAALVATILLGYRFFVTFFPILPASGQSRPRPEPWEHETFPVTPGMTRFYRGCAAAILLAFVVIYALVHKQAIAQSERAFRDLHLAHVVEEPEQKPAGGTHSGRPGNYRNFYLLEDVALKQQTDLFEPVRFSHRTHDAAENGNCAVCHHRLSFDLENDRVGEDLRGLHLSIEVRIGGACASCHEDLEEKTFQSCRVCHGASNEADAPARLGLKGAYHQQCIGCHERQSSGANAPIDCRSCHRRRVPDHAALVVLPGAPTPRQVTEACLRCHERAGAEVLASAHWNWRGETPATAGQEFSISNGLINVIDNYSLSMLPSLVPSGAYHVSTTWGGPDFDFQDAGAIDCLICHDATSVYRKGKGGGAAPPPELDLAAIARGVGHPRRTNCSCHFTAAGGPNLKHGDLSPTLAAPSPDSDVHMGAVDMRCQDCHTTRDHRIAGLCFNAPVVEGRVRCEQCHGDRPHGISGVLSKHLDRHVATVACQTCHIPFFARGLPTELLRDYAPAGGGDAEPPLALGSEVRAAALFDSLSRHDPAIVRQSWGKRVIPVYRWFDGTREAYLTGQTIDPSGTVVLNQPLGSRQDPIARIFPFKLHLGRQPYDAGNNVLAPVKFADGLWRDGDWDAAVAGGMQAASLEYSGSFAWATTEMYTSTHHEVAPARQALGCADCHDAKAVSCGRCHDLPSDWEAPPLAAALHDKAGGRLDFGALGYTDDPARAGGRFARPLGRGRPVR